jgi:hypothetical protein
MRFREAAGVDGKLMTQVATPTGISSEAGMSGYALLPKRHMSARATPASPQ